MRSAARTCFQLPTLPLEQLVRNVETRRIQPFEDTFVPDGTTRRHTCAKDNPTELITVTDNALDPYRELRTFNEFVASTIYQ